MDLALPLLFGAAVLAGAQNAVAGGGSFLTFPMLLWTGLGSKVANATNTVALWPGSVASAFGFRRDVRHERRILVAFALVSLVGGLLGAWLLWRTAERTFDRLIPFLLAAATLIFAFGPPVSARLRTKHAHDGPIPARKLLVFAVVQFGVGLYGGYFGGGMGIIMLAAFSALGMENLSAMNGLKAILGAIINGIAIVLFWATGLVDWPVALVMVAGSLLGGYAGARLSRKADPQRVRSIIIAIGAILSVDFFLATFA